MVLVGIRGVVLHRHVWADCCEVDVGFSLGLHEVCALRSVSSWLTSGAN